MNENLRQIGISRVNEAIASGEDLIELIGRLFSGRTTLPDLLFGGIEALINARLAGRDKNISATVLDDPVMQTFLNGSRNYMVFEMLQAVVSNDVFLQARQLECLAKVIHAMRDAGCTFEFVEANPVQTVTPVQPVINIKVQPAPVTVNNAFPTQAIQTVERDSRDEIVSTLTTYA